MIHEVPLKQDHELIPNKQRLPETEEKIETWERPTLSYYDTDNTASWGADGRAELGWPRAKTAPTCAKYHWACHRLCEAPGLVEVLNVKDALW